MPAVKEWEVLAQQSLDSVLEPGADPAADESELGLSSASINWRGDGKYFATVSLSAGKSLVVSQLAKIQHGIILCLNLNRVQLTLRLETGTCSYPINVNTVKIVVKHCHIACLYCIIGTNRP